jgi:hypothetical protein
MRGHLRLRKTAHAEVRRVGADQRTPRPSSHPSFSWRGKRVVVRGAGICRGEGEPGRLPLPPGGEALFKSAQTRHASLVSGPCPDGTPDPRRRRGEIRPRPRGALCFAGSPRGVTRMARRRARAVRVSHPTDRGYRAPVRELPTSLHAPDHKHKRKNRNNRNEKCYYVEK